MATEHVSGLRCWAMRSERSGCCAVGIYDEDLDRTSGRSEIGHVAP